MHASSRFAPVFISALLLTISGLLTGCTLATTAPDAPVPGTALHGVSYGAGQPVVGQHVYLMAAAVSGVGSAGYGNASTSLLTGTGHSDSIGSYVLSGSDGSWALNSGPTTYYYTCPSANTQVYVYGVGGNPGAGTNSAASMMLALGSCGSLSSSTSVYMNELSTVAAAYSLAGFATDALHVSIPLYATTAMQTANTTDALAQTDLQNAFSNANNLVATATGVAQTTTPGGNGTPNTSQVITLGNLMAACVNSSDTSNANCTTLFSNALSGGSTGTTPTETATAAINIAHNPYVSSTVMSNLWALQPSTGAPFAGGDTTQPTDFTVGIKFTGGGLSGAYSVAIDGSGNVWVANSSANRISEFSSTGAAITSSSGYTGGGLDYPYAIAIDGSGNAWVVSTYANPISEFTSGGTAISSSSGYTGGGLNGPHGIAIDSSGNAWVANSSTSSISKFSSGGTATSGSSGYTGGGLSHVRGIAIDGSGNAWTTNENTSSTSKFSSTGTALSSSSGYTGGALNFPVGIAIDGSGDVWVTNLGNSTISELIGAATPVVTPLAANFISPYSAPASKP